MNNWTPLKYYEGIYEVNDKGRIRSIKSKSSEYSAWEALKQRCTNENHHSYTYSGGQLCKQWFSFVNFINDLGKKNNPKDVLIRLDNTKPYCLTNCRWGTRSEFMKYRQKAKKKVEKKTTGSNDDLIYHQW